MQATSFAINSDWNSDLNLKNISNKDLLLRTENLVQTERKIMHLVLTHISEIMERKLYADLGFDSMYTMMIKKYGYSEPSALRRIDAAKLLKKVPEVADRLKSGALNLSQACQLQKCLASEAKKGGSVSETRTHEILEKLETCNGFATKQLLAQEFDLPLKSQEIVRPQKDESVRLEITFTKEEFEELKKAKSLLSHIAHTGSWAEVISVMAKKLNQSKLGKPASSVQTNNSNNFQSQSGSGFNSKPKTDSESINIPKAGSATEPKDLQLESALASASKIRRPHISVHLIRKLYAEADGCCQYQSPDEIRCGSKFQFQIDHITPVTWGGETSLENLRLLCRTHNLLAARQLGLHHHYNSH